MPPLNVVVLTSGALGLHVATALRILPEVRSLAVMTTRVTPRHGPLEKARRIYRYYGAPGLVGSALGRLRHPLSPAGQDLAALVAGCCPGATHLHCDDLHAPESIARLRALAPDLGVVFATYPLKAEVFSVPRLGCLNLHLGRAPEFRGSSPGFYEMLEGVGTVGVTIHQVSSELDGGPIILQEHFPLDLMPDEDPIHYLRSYQTEILIPNGVRMMAEAVRRMARGEAEEQQQPPCATRPRRRATYQLKRELRRRVHWRRIHRAGSLAGA